MEDAYLAGLFDGEGSVGIYRIGNGRDTPSGQVTYWAARASIAGTHRPMIEAVCDSVAGSSFIGDTRKKDCVTPTKRYSQGHHRPSFKMQVQNRKNLRALLLRVRPYLIEKAEQVDIVLRFLSKELPGEQASVACKAAKRFTFSNTGAVAVRKSLASGTESSCSTLTAEDVADMRSRFAAGERQLDIAEAYGVNRQMVWRVVRGKNYPKDGGPISATPVNRRKLTDAQRKAIRRRITAGESQAALAREYNVGTTTLCRVAAERP